MGVNDVLGNGFLEQWGIRWNTPWMLAFVAMSGDEIGAVGRAVDGDFALGAAADSADFLRLGGAEALSFALFANRTGHGRSQFSRATQQNT